MKVELYAEVAALTAIRESFLGHHRSTIKESVIKVNSERNTLKQRVFVAKRKVALPVNNKRREEISYCTINLKGHKYINTFDSLFSMHIKELHILSPSELSYRATLQVKPWCNIKRKRKMHECLKFKIKQI